MSMPCPSCGKAIADDSKFCPGCGSPITPTLASPGTPAPATVSTIASAAPTPTPLPPSSAAPGSPASPGHVHSTPNIKLIAGCGGAGCLVMLLILVVALIFIFAGTSGGGGGGGGGPSLPGGGQQPNGPGSGPMQGGNPTSNSGPLDKLISKQVGDFSLRQAQRIQEMIAKGAVDAVQMQYAKNDGTQAAHNLIAMPQENQADQLLDAFAKGYQQNGFTQKSAGDRTDPNGQKIGRYLLMNSNQGTLVLWTNGQVLAAVQTPTEQDAINFVKASPY